MANKSKIVTTPLVGDLNLSQNKLDTIPIGDSGYLRNDGVIYGNTLSPIYQSMSNYDAEYYTKDGQRVEITNHNLVIDNDEKMSFNHFQLKEEKLPVNDLLSYEGGAYTRADESSLYIKVHNADDEHSFDFSDYNIASVLTARSIYNVGAIVLYINTNRKYILSYWDATGQLAFKQLSWTEVNTPLLTWFEKADNLYFISAFSDSGADFQGSANSYGLTTDGQNSEFKALAFFPKSESTETVSTSVSYYYKDFLRNLYQEPIATSEPIEGTQDQNMVINQKYTLAMPSDINWENPCGIEIKIYYTSAMKKTVESGVATFTGSSFQEILETDITSLTEDYIDDFQNAYNVNTTQYSNFGNYYMQNDRNFTVMAGDTWLDRALDKVTVESKINGRIRTAVIVPGHTIPGWAPNNIPPLLYMDGMNTDKKAAGFLWADVKWTSAGVEQHKRFKLFPQSTSDVEGFHEGWDYTALYKPDIDEAVTEETRMLITATKVSTIPIHTLINPNAFLDDGTLICTKVPANVTDDTHFETGKFSFTATIDSIEETASAWFVNFNTPASSSIYLSLAEDTSHAYPYSFISRTISIDKNFFRYVLHTKGFEPADATETKADETVIMYDSGFGKMIVNPGYYTGNGSLSNGSLYQAGNYRVLYNNNIVSNISYGNGDSIGTLLCDWNIIDEVLSINSDGIVIRDSFGNVIKYSDELIPNNGKPEYKVINDRFIVINTTSYYNCYDLKNRQKLHYASDYNNRFLMGYQPFGSFIIGQDNNNMFERNTLIETAIEGSAQNANYEITNNPISSYKLEPEVIANVWMRTNPFMLKSETTQAIDIYFSMNAATAVYFTSYINGVYVREPALESAYLPLGVVYNPNIFTKIIETYLLDAFAVNEKNKTAYPLNKYNGQLFLSYKMLNGLENAENMFCIQTLIYMISQDKIWEVYYDNGTLSNLQAIAPIKGLKYLGCLPTAAIFWSPKDRTFWSFTGDAILRKIIQANEISTIYGSWYDTTTQYLYVGTNIGLLCLNDVNNFLLKDLKKVTDMWFFDTYSILKNVTGTVAEPIKNDWKISFIPSVLNEDAYMHLTTKWFGSTENYKTRFDCIYFRLAKPELNVTPKFTISSNVMTDMGFETDIKSVNPVTFDELTNTAYIRWQPKYQTAVSMSFEITTNCPIISWSIGNTPLDEMAQISVINI